MDIFPKLIFGNYFWENTLFLGKSKSRKALILLDFLVVMNLPKNRLPKNLYVTGQLQISFLRAKILFFYIPMKSPFHPEIHAIYLLKTRAFLHLIPYFAPKHQKKTLRTSDHSKVLRVFLF